jgi:hypothetical protein
VTVQTNNENPTTKNVCKILTNFQLDVKDSDRDEFYYVYQTLFYLSHQCKKNLCSVSGDKQIDAAVMLYMSIYEITNYFSHATV